MGSSPIVSTLVCSQSSSGRNVAVASQWIGLERRPVAPRYLRGPTRAPTIGRCLYRGRAQDEVPGSRSAGHWSGDAKRRTGSGLGSGGRFGDGAGRRTRRARRRTPMLSPRRPSVAQHQEGRRVFAGVERPLERQVGAAVDEEGGDVLAQSFFRPWTREEGVMPVAGPRATPR